MLEYQLNKIFFNSAGVDQIYITNNDTSNQLLMGQTSQYSGTMSNSSAWSNYYMGNVYSPTQYNFTVNVPFPILDTQATISAVVDRYRLPGMNYEIVGY
jgi:hypothetical protein